MRSLGSAWAVETLSQKQRVRKTKAWCLLSKLSSLKSYLLLYTYVCVHARLHVQTL